MEKSRNNQTKSSKKSCKPDFPISELLPVGKENAISGEQLKQLAGCKSIRELQHLIADERNRGAIICSGSSKGYWRPKDRQEIERFCQSMTSRANNILSAAKSARSALEIPEGQQEMFKDGGVSNGK